METLTGKAEFHAGHRQLGYEGKCAWVHGHTWRGSCTVSTERFGRDDTLDMSMDFGALKDIFKALDHKMLVSDTDPLFTNPELFDPEGVVVIPGGNPNVENVAEYCLNQTIDALAKRFGERGQTYTVDLTIQETDNNIFTIHRSVTL